MSEAENDECARRSAWVRSRPAFCEENGQRKGSMGEERLMGKGERRVALGHLGRVRGRAVGAITGHRHIKIATGVCLATLLGAFGPVLTARASDGFGSLGSAAGQFNEPRGIAISQATGDIYLSDRNNQRLEEFDSQGNFLKAWGWGVADQQPEFEQCLRTCTRGQEGAGNGQVAFPEGIAINNDPLSTSYEDLYVVDARNNRVLKFDPNGNFLLAFGGEVNQTTGADICTASEACGTGQPGTGHGFFELASGEGGDYISVDAAGTVYVGDMNRIQEFSPEGAYIAEIALPGAEKTFALAIDSSGAIYAGSRSPSFSGIRKYSPAGALEYVLDAESDPANSESGRPGAIAVGPGNDLFVDDQGEGSVGHHILQYSPTGQELTTFDAGEPDGSRGISWDTQNDELYILNQDNSERVAEVRTATTPGAGPVLVGGQVSADIEQTRAVLHATVNPEGHATQYRFEYGPTASYGSVAPDPEGALPASFADEALEAELTGLESDQLYHYRIVAESEGHTVIGPDRTFTTLADATIQHEFTTDVTATAATLGAEFATYGLSSEYHFEYGPSAAYGMSTFEQSTSVNQGATAATIHVQQLTAGTVYHFRLVLSVEREGTTFTAEGPDSTFTTPGISGEGLLPDDRAWELVTPPNKRGSSVETIFESGVIQSAADGESLTYLTSAPTEADPRGYANLVQVMATRGPDGWTNKDMATAHEAATTVSIGQGQEYRFFSEDLNLGLVEPRGLFTPLSTEASEKTPYLRTRSLCANEEPSSACYRPLVTATGSDADVAPSVKFGGEHLNSEPQGGVTFAAASPDLERVFLKSQVALTSTSAEPGALYAWLADSPSTQKLQAVSVPTNGSVAVSAAVGFDGRSTSNAVSRDGSRIFWTEEGGQKHLYMTDVPMGESVWLDQPQLSQGATGEGSAQPRFQGASSNGGVAFFTDEQGLTPGASTAGADLYECVVAETEGHLTCNLVDLTPGSGSGVTGTRRADVLGVVAVSDSGEEVYFVANGVLSGGEDQLHKTAVAGADNLYTMHFRSGADEWEPPQFLGTLSNADAMDWTTTLTRHTARLSPNGRWLAFMSNSSLTGYDNTDAVSGQPDEEVYVYDSTSRTLACASCNPDGARPTGLESTEIGLLVGGFQVWTSNTWLAANVPGWTPFRLEQSRYQSRYLSNNGRLFFDSNDALVPQDINGTEDVYEWEPAAVGSCTISSGSYSRQEDGCLALISSGASQEESAFLDASEEGNNVFFLTGAKLVTSDFDTSLDIYDAHICSEASPCMSVEAAPNECDTTDSCRAAPLPQPKVFGSPPSATFSGKGNVAASHALAKSKAKAKGRGSAWRRKLRKALRACERKRGKKVRRCQVQTRKRAASKRAANTKAKKGGAR